MYFDGAIFFSRNGMSMVIISLGGRQSLIFIMLQFDYTYNVVKYEAYIQILEVVL